jgi:hypothetical protein
MSFTLGISYVVAATNAILIENTLKVSYHTLFDVYAVVSLEVL